MFGRGQEPTCHGLDTNKTSALSLFEGALSPSVRQVMTENMVGHRRKENTKMIITTEKANGLTIANELSNIVINK